MDTPKVSGDSLQAVRQELNLSFHELWLTYVAVGGSRSLPELVAHLSRGGEWPRGDHLYVVAALNDRFFDLGMGHPLAFSLDPSAEG